MSFLKFCFALLIGSKPTGLCVCLGIIAMINAFVSPYFYTEFTFNYLSESDYAISCLFTFYAFTVFSEVVKLYSNGYKDDYMLYVTEHMTEKYLLAIYGAEWLHVQNIKKEDLNLKMSKSKNDTGNFVYHFIDSVFSIMSIFGALYVIVLIFPVSLMVWVACLVMYYYLHYRKQADINVKKRNETIDSTQKIRKVIRQTKDNLLHRVIHHKMHETVDTVVKSSVQIEKHWTDFFKLRTKTMSYLTIVNIACTIFNIWLFVNCTLVASTWIPFVFPFVPIENIDVAIKPLIAYLYYVRTISNTMQTFTRLYEAYSSAKNSYDIMERELENFVQREEIEQIYTVKALHISDLYYYLTDGTREFTLQMHKGDKLAVYAGDIVLVDGDSGHGKSKFYSLLTGIVSHKDYHGDIEINGQRVDHKFQAMTQTRSFRQQKSDSSCLGTPFFLITGIHATDPCKLADQEEEVWDILTMVCNDFIKREDLHQEIKTMDGFSGGQIGRIENAKSIWEARESSVLVLDEPDGALNHNMRVQIIQNIVKYCRMNNIMLWLTLHSHEIKDAIVVDHHIELVNGLITIN